MVAYKRPESVLVVIVSLSTQRYLMLQRKDDTDFWQSVTGSLEANETPRQTALREVKEETGIDIEQQSLVLHDCHKCVIFEIFPQFRHRYAPEVGYNKEHWFYLPLEDEISPLLSEHEAFQWLALDDALCLMKSPNNQQAVIACQQWLASKG